MKLSNDDPIGFVETIVEYYTGRDASQLSDDALIRKLGHIGRIRELESKGKG